MDTCLDTPKHVFQKRYFHISFQIWIFLLEGIYVKFSWQWLDWWPVVSGLAQTLVIGPISQSRNFWREEFLKGMKSIRRCSYYPKDLGPSNGRV